MSGDTVGAVKIDYETNRVQYEQDVKAIIGITKEARSVFSQVMGEQMRLADRLSGADATRRLGIMEQAVQKLGGMGGVAKGQLEGLRKEIDSLVNAGGKLPSLFESLHASGGKMPSIGAMIPEVAGPGAAARIMGTLGGLGNIPGLQGATSDLAALGTQATAAGAALGPVGIAAVAVGTAATVMGGAVVGTTKFLIDSTTAVLDHASALVNLAAGTGVSVEELQELRAAAADTDTELTTVTAGIQNMKDKLFEGDSVFGRLGMDVDALRAKRPQQAFVEVGEAIAGLSTDLERTNAARDVFGKGLGDQLLPLLMTDMPAAFQAARDAGIIMTTDTAEAADALGTEVRKLGEQWDAATSQAGQAIAQSPEVKAVFEDLRETLGRATKFLVDHKQELAGVVATGVNAARGVVTLINALSGLEAKLSALIALKPGGALGAILNLATGGALGAVDSLAKIGAASKGPASDMPDFGGVQSGHSSSTDQPYISAAELAKRKAAAAEAAKDAEKVRAAWQKAAEEARKDWDKFYADFEQRGRNAIGGLQDDIDKRVKKLAPTGQQTLQLLEDLATATEGMMVLPAEAAAYSAKVAREELVDLLSTASGILGALSSGLQALGVDMDSIIGKGLGLAEAGASLGTAIASGDLVGMIQGGFQVAAQLKGIFDKPEFERIGKDVGRRFGVAISEGLSKQIEETEKSLGVGRHMAELLNLSSIMGESDKDPREFADDMQDLMNGIALGAVPAKAGLEELGSAFDMIVQSAEAAGSVGDAALRGILRRARELGQLTPEMKAFVESRLSTVVENVTQFVGGLSKLDGEFGRMGANSATLFMAAFNAVAKERGRSGAVKELGDEYETLRDKLTEIGDEAGLALLAPFEQAYNYSQNEVLAGAMDTVAAVNQIMSGLADVDYLDVDQFRAAQETIADLFNHMTEGGMDTKSALLEVAPSIQSALRAAEQFGVPLSEDLQRLKDLAEQNGISFSPDPMTRAADSMDRVATALERILGIGGDVADTFDRIGDSAGSVHVPGTGVGIPHDRENTYGIEAPPLAGGGVLMAPLSGAPFVGHGMEGVIPLQEGGAAPIAARLLEDLRAAGGLGGGGTAVQFGDIHATVPEGVTDPEAWAGAILAAVVRGVRGQNSELMAALADAGAGRSR